MQSDPIVAIAELRGATDAHAWADDPCGLLELIADAVRADRGLSAPHRRWMLSYLAAGDRPAAVRGWMEQGMSQSAAYSRAEKCCILLSRYDDLVSSWIAAGMRYEWCGVGSVTVTDDWTTQRDRDITWCCEVSLAVIDGYESRLRILQESVIDGEEDQTLRWHESACRWIDPLVAALCERMAHNGISDRIRRLWRAWSADELQESILHDVWAGDPAAWILRMLQDDDRRGRIRASLQSRRRDRRRRMRARSAESRRERQESGETRPVSGSHVITIGRTVIRIPDRPMTDAERERIDNKVRRAERARALRMLDRALGARN